MALLPILLALLPTLVWVLIWLWIRPATGSLTPLVVGVVIGASLTVPAWFTETLVDDLTHAHNRWSHDFLEQVVGAACCEELLKFAGVIAVLRWLNQRPSRLSDAIPVALAVGIGFMTAENTIAVMLAETPMRMASSRLVTVLAGHPSYQLVMGFCLVRWSIRGKVGWAVAAIALPILMHGWSDFSEQLFTDEPTHGSARDTWEFAAWIGSITTSLMASVLIVAYAVKRSRA